MIQIFLEKYAYKFKNDWPRYTILILWLIVNLIAFTAVYISYKTALEYFYLRKIVQEGICWSKASAFCINLNCSILLLFVCRNFISYTRYLLCLPTNVKRVFDKHITFHRYVGYLVLFFSTTHTLGHIHNLESFISAKDAAQSASDPENLSGLLSTLSNIRGEYYLNPVRTENALPIIEAIKMVPGITGILLCIILLIFASTSSFFIRHYFYNLFWYVHQVSAVLFIIFFCVHGLQGVVRRQINLDSHNPEKCYQFYSEWPFSRADRVCDMPKFTSNSATSWMWVIGPITLYIIERFARFIRGLLRHKIEKFVIHPSNVLELMIDNSKKIINYRAGQYIFINISDISWFEWHPFTVTSAPDDKYLTVHIRSAGDWTESLIKSIASKDSGDLKPAIKHICIDGPYGTCAEDILKYETAVLIGAGIGVTPYASILRYIWHKLGSKRNSLQTKSKLKKVYFFWICPSIDTFEWFGVLLQDLEKEMMNNAENDLLEYKLYVTRGWSLKEAKQIAINHNEDIDLFTGLKQKTNYGRPNFDAFFKELADKRKSNEGLNETSTLRKQDNIGVFFCGPPTLSYELHKVCNKYSNEATRFIYNKESF